MALLVVGGDVGWILVGQDGALVDVELCEEDGCDMLRGHGREEERVETEDEQWEVEDDEGNYFKLNRSHPVTIQSRYTLICLCVWVNNNTHCLLFISLSLFLPSRISFDPRHTYNTYNTSNTYTYALTYAHTRSHRQEQQTRAHRRSTHTIISTYSIPSFGCPRSQ